MEDDFGDDTFGDPACCGGYSNLLFKSDCEESDSAYQTPKQHPVHVMKEQRWSLPNQTSHVSSATAPSSSSAGNGVFHPPLDLATMFASAIDDSGKTVKTDLGIGTPYSITESTHRWFHFG